MNVIKISAVIILCFTVEFINLSVIFNCFLFRVVAKGWPFSSTSLWPPCSRGTLHIAGNRTEDSLISSNKHKPTERGASWCWVIVIRVQCFFSHSLFSMKVMEHPIGEWRSLLCVRNSLFYNDFPKVCIHWLWNVNCVIVLVRQFV